MKTLLNPDSLPRNPGFSQVVVVQNAEATIYVAGRTRSPPTAGSAAIHSAS